MPHINPPDLPLAGVRVADFTRVLTGPYCTMLLADLGADVVKVEPPGGDDTRAWGPPHKGDQATYYLSVNRNKRSVVLDLKNADGLAAAQTLIGSCDILVENYRPGTMERLGLGWDELKTQHPRLIYAAISGFGQSGPYRDRPGYDLIAQGMGGVMAYTGEPDGPPMKLGVAVADVYAGALMTQAILAALYARERHGRGQRVDVNLLEGMLSLGTYQVSRFLNAAEVPEQLGNAHRSIVPYGMFACADGHLNIAVGNDALWVRFCDALGLDELKAEPDFATNAGRVGGREDLLAALEAELSRHPRAELLARLEAAGVPCGPVYDLAEVFDDPHVQARGLAVTLPHPTLGTVATTAPPWEFDGRRPPVRRAPPTLGQHTDELLSELGLSPEGTDHA